MLPVIVYITFLLAGCGSGGHSSIPQATVQGVTPSQISPTSPSPSAPSPTPGPGSSAAPTAAPTSGPASGPGPLFANSAVTMTVPANPPLASYSSAVASYIAGFQHPIGYVRASSVSMGANNVVTHNGWSLPIYDSYPGDPVVSIHCNTPSWGCPTGGGYIPNGGIAMSAIHLPAHAWSEGPTPNCSGDCHLAVIDHSYSPPIECEFYQASQPSGPNNTWATGSTITATNASCTSTAATGWPAGQATHSGIAYPAYVVRGSEMLAGNIPHAIFMAVNCANDPGVFPSAKATDESCGSGSQYPHYGDHVWLDLSDADINALVGPDANTKTLYRALHDYGGIIGDTGYGDNNEGLIFQIDDDVASIVAGKPGPWATLFAQEGLSVNSNWDFSNSPQAGNLGSDWWAQHLHILSPCVAANNC